ncbi:MAG: hypothetical protein ACOY0R_07300 [Chloroflexota bacterium]
MTGLPPEQEARIRQIAQSGRMIEAIKEYRLLTNAGLAESKAAVEALRFGVGVPASAPMPPGMDSSRQRQILDLMAQDRKIEAIKLYRGWTGADLKQAKDAVEALERGGTIHIPEAAAPARAGGAAFDDPIRTLLARGQKIEAIKLYRLATNAGLAEAKEYVDAIEAQMPESGSLAQSDMGAIGDDPFAEENSRTRRMLVLAFLFVAIVAALAFFFFRNGL